MIMKYLLAILLFSACTAQPSLKYEAIDWRGEKFTIHQPITDSMGPLYQIGDTMTIYLRQRPHTAYPYDKRRISSQFKNVIITKKK